MGEVIQGVDISHHNKIEAIKFSQYKFCMCKATEGKTFKDNKYQYHSDFLLKSNVIIGAYHYARPENNNYKDEANNFIDSIRKFIHNTPVVLALDWEGTALNYGADWPLNWLEYVYHVTGIKPLFYVQNSHLLKYQNIADYDYGLWLAHWTDESTMRKNNFGKWKYPAMWQFTSKPYDINIFYGSAKQLIKYGIRKGNA